MEDGLFDAPPPSSPPPSGWQAPEVPVDAEEPDRAPAEDRRPGADRADGGGAVPSRVLGEPTTPTAAADRRCARPTCSRRAMATMTYDYANRTAWVDALTAAPLPQGYDLCADHADRLGVPQGWTSTDRRPAYLPDRLAG